MEIPWWNDFFSLLLFVLHMFTEKLAFFKYGQGILFVFVLLYIYIIQSCTVLYCTALYSTVQSGFSNFVVKFIEIRYHEEPPPNWLLEFKGLKADHFAGVY